MITITSVLNIASICKLREKLTDEEWLEFSGRLAHAYRESLLEDVAEMLEKQHTWITNVSAANLVREMKGPI